jgi:hypothetical protein
MFPLHNVHSCPKLIHVLNEITQNSLKNELGSLLSNKLLKIAENGTRNIEQKSFLEVDEISLDHLVLYGFLWKLSAVAKKSGAFKYSMCCISMVKINVPNDIFMMEGLILEKILSQHFSERKYDVSKSLMFRLHQEVFGMISMELRLI